MRVMYSIMDNIQYIMTISYYYDFQNQYTAVVHYLRFTSQYFIVFGYLLFTISFTLRLYYAFKDSIIGACLIVLALIFRLFCEIIDIIYNAKTCNFSLYVLFVNISIVILLFCEISYIFSSIYLIRLMIIKIAQFSLMIALDENENEKENKMNMNMNGNSTSNLCKDMFQLIKKLIVLYTVSFL